MVKIRVLQTDGSYRGGLFDTKQYGVMWPIWYGTGPPGYMERMYYMTGRSWMRVELADVDIALDDSESDGPFAPNSIAIWQTKVQVIDWFDRHRLELPARVPDLWSRGAPAQLESDELNSCVQLLREVRELTPAENAFAPADLLRFEQQTLKRCLDLRLLELHPQLVPRDGKDHWIAIGSDGHRLLAGTWIHDTDESRPVNKNSLAQIGATDEEATIRRRLKPPLAERVCRAVAILTGIDSEWITSTDLDLCEVPTQTVFSAASGWSPADIQGRGTPNLMYRRERVIRYLVDIWTPRDAGS